MCVHEVGRRIREIKGDIESRGAKLVLIGEGHVMFAQGFKQDLEWDGEIYTDPSRKVFHVANLKELGIWEGMYRFFIDATDRSFLGRLLKRDKTHKAIEGVTPHVQMGGTFVVSGGKNSEILYSFFDADHRISTFADNQEILKALDTISSK